MITADLAPNLTLHLGVQGRSIKFCALWYKDQCLLWDSLMGFHEDTPAQLEQSVLSSFDVRACHLIRRNCFLLGANITATEEEMQQWNQWLDAK
ncbi:MAG: hypothetical protein EOP04_28750 [Proteobacteria bacterium]|nr:MAG: hypothetical protein EOP04_28750 [Pseudomonadota bacterium]